MAHTDIPTTDNKWCIFFEGATPLHWFNSALEECTSYNGDFWTIEEFETEETWIIRLAELGIIIESE